LDTTQFTIFVSAGFALSKNSFCKGDSTQITFYGFTNQVTITPTAHVRWVDSNKAWLTPDTTSTFNISGSSSCLGNYAQSFPVNVIPPPQVSITQHGDTLIGHGGVFYQWLLNGQAMPGAVSPVLVASVPGTYTLQASDSLGCTASSTPVPVIITGIDETGKSYISVNPNPTSTGWVLTVSSAFYHSGIEVYDATGRIVFRSEILDQKSQIYIPSLASGIYELHINSLQGIFVRKLVKIN
jgi:hypothetical protein